MFINNNRRKVPQDEIRIGEPKSSNNPIKVIPIPPNLINETEVVLFAPNFEEKIMEIYKVE